MREDGADDSGDKLGGRRAGDDLVGEAEALYAVAAAVLPRVLRVHGAAQQLGEEQRAHGSRRAVEDHVVTAYWRGATCLVRVRVGV